MSNPSRTSDDRAARRNFVLLLIFAVAFVTAMVWITAVITAE